MKNLLLCFIFLELIGCASAPIPDPYKFKSQYKGEFSNVPLVPKDFIKKGFVYAESKVVINDFYGTKEGSEITNDMLIKKAEELGADDVVNVKIDKIENVRYEKAIAPSGETKFVKVTIIAYKAVGLAIKYK